MLQLRCPLGHVLEIEAEHFGQRLMCPLCQAVVHAIAPRAGNPPSAKYEVQCAKGHILRVKQKYLGKEVECPSCQQTVSMKAQNLLNAEGVSMGVARPDLFQKKKPAQQPRPEPAPAQSGPLAMPTVKNTSLKPRYSSSRIPPPPLPEGHGTDDPPPLVPEVVEEEVINLEQPAKQAAPAVAGGSAPEEFEFEVVDTQFHMELGESGVDAPKAPPVKKSKKEKQPKHATEPPPIRREAPISLTPPAPVATGQPTGLHTLSNSELMKVQLAALQQAEPAKAQFECPSGHLLEVEEQYRGMHIQCPLCNVVFELPK